MASRLRHKRFRGFSRCSGNISGPSPILFRDRGRFHFISLQFFIGLIILFGPLVRICPGRSAPQDNPHHFQQYCGDCHTLSAKADNNKDQRIGPLHRDINSSCSQGGCHDLRSAINHPVGVRPSGHIPSDMPLNAKGQITCLTCHDELNGSNSDHLPAFLRRSSGGDLCASCHQGSGDTAKKRSHWQFTTKAHLASNKGKSLSEDSAQRVGDIDLESYTCLGCHDNTSAVVIRDNESTLKQPRRRSEMSDHPIGMSYAIKASRNSSDFNMPLTMNTRIRLFDGRVGCGSCHNLYNNEKKNLAVPSSNGNLCRQCHIR